ncbi:hypothetical protein [Enterovibrio coralii]|uniref:Sarcosine oxidase n=1 Tax=Enterovibrio coralii TaxID=294935 RepID=A0A135I8W0_9GAMM|nr:hypothetical protein [Enterovibrio coralii]KXF81886.1 hypothetical protein ATN88_20595 [Enterovibrio coralii]
MSSFLVSTQAQNRLSNIEQVYSLSSISFFDATTSNRIGFRGQKTASFLKEHGLSVPAQPNQALEMPDGLWVLKLSYTEFWVIDKNSQNAEFITELETKVETEKQVTRLYCQHSHALFVLTGDDCPAMFAKVCGVDLTEGEFESGQIAQTSVARVSSVVVNVSKRELKQTRFLILSDISSADYLWKALGDAATEFQ